MIYLYTGAIGSGKTLMAVDNMLAYFSRGAIVTTNIGLDMAEVSKLSETKFGCTVSAAQYKYLNDGDTARAHEFCVPSRPGKENLLVIDECNIFFPARGYAENATKAKAFLAWLVQSRKIGVDVVMIIQHPNNLDAQIRRIAQFECLFRDLRKYPIPILGIRPLAWVHVMSCGTFETGATDPIDRRIFAPDTRLYKLYKTCELKTPFEMSENPEFEQRRKKTFAYYAEHYLKGLVIWGTLLGLTGCGWAEKREYASLTNQVGRLLQKMQDERKATGSNPSRAPGGPETIPAIPVVTGFALLADGTSCCLDGAWVHPGALVPGKGTYLGFDERRSSCAFLVGRAIVSVPVMVKRETTDASKN